MSEKRFYDIHFHSMNLAHPNILAFIRRINWRLLPLAFPLAPIVALLGGEKVKNVQNLLTVMENDTGSFFLLVEYYLKLNGTIKDNKITIGENSFDSIVITPLMMDFGYKNILTDTFYKIPPQKPIAQQVEDVFNGIAKYCACELVEAEGGPDEKIKSYKIIPRKSKAIFEIYPFLGINTKNYDDANHVAEILNKYFSNYRGFYADFRDNLGKFDGNIKDMRSNFFVGIKLYPPIGFDPWPEGNNKEIAKVELLYAFCCDKQIPVTVHCSDGGFALHKEAKTFTCPDRWERVLSQDRFRTLKLNFAHFGKQNKKKLFLIPKHEWRDKIVRLIKAYPNVYTDMSYVALDDKHCETLEEIVNKHPQLADKLLFGSDFMINLLAIDSYNRYLEVFSGTGCFGNMEKFKFCNTNAESFLWRNMK